MAPSPPSLIGEFAEEHLEELAYLWNRRLSMERASGYAVREFRDIEERIEARMQALLSLGTRSELADFVTSFPAELGSEIFARAYALLRIGSPEAAHAVLDSIAAAAPDVRERLIDALCHGALPRVLSNLEARGKTTDDSLRMQLARLAAFHNIAIPVFVPTNELLRNEDTATRRLAWRAACLQPERIKIEWGLSGVLDADVEVCRYALETVAWSGHPWLLEHCRRSAARPALDKIDELKMLCILSTHEEATPLTVSLGKNTALGYARFELLGTLAQPECIDFLLAGIASPDPRAAVAAGNAFSRITGCTLRVTQQVPLAPEDGHEPDEFEKEFLDIAYLPDAEDAARQWREIKNNFQPGHRYSGGTDITETPTDWSEVDMASRWEINLRNAYYGKPHLRPADLERFPCQLVPSHTAKPTAPKPKTYLVGMSD